MAIDYSITKEQKAGDMIWSEHGLVIDEGGADVSSEQGTFSNENGGEDMSHVMPIDYSIAKKQNAGDMICSGHGLSVNDSVINVSSEQSAIKNENGSEGTSCVSGATSPNSSGNSLYQNRHSTSRSDRTLMIALMTISTMCDRINLTKSIRDRAYDLFMKVQIGQNLTGHSNNAISAACLYTACRQEGVPRTFKEIVAVSSVSKKEIGRCFWQILKFHDTSREITRPGEFINRFCGSLCLQRDVQRAAANIAKKAIDLDLLPARSPISVAAASIYMASQASENKKSLKEIANIAGVGNGTIRQSYNQMLPRAAELFPDGFKFTNFYVLL